MKINKKVLLMILDGWGIADHPEKSAISKAQTPNYDNYLKKFPNAKLLTHGEHVGLPEGQMGNSEVGHMNIGSGRVVMQELAKINFDIKNNSFDKDKVLSKKIKKSIRNNKNIHIIGLVSDGGVHSHIDHLKHIINMTDQMNAKNVFIHAFTDGRDVDPKSGINFITELIEFTKNKSAELATLCGRYYSMDRDQRWERIKKAYELLVNGVGEPTKDVLNTIKMSYEKGITDEFINPIVLEKNGKPITQVLNGDLVVFFNFRTDRGRQLTEALTQKNIPDYGMVKVDIDLVTMTVYNDDFVNIDSIYHKEILEETLGQVLSMNNKKQIRIAETEKYPHVTFFFNGGNEKIMKDEKRIMCNSPKVATYDLKPEMSAHEIVSKIIPEIETWSAEFICLNFANPDMVGHTGNFSAAVSACEVVDDCMGKVVDKCIKNNYSIIIIADHGNSDVMINIDGSANTAHTTNPVPIIVIDKKVEKVEDGILADIAPTVLKLLDIKQPKLMTGKILI
ncbi:MAG: 2,3-bisphosphoglycerate-independent phosphoglycerate mutase [Flavobacteriaceae bacterium]